MADWKPDIFEYLDYREYLRDFYQDGKEHAGCSYRSLARKAGFTSPNFYKLVMDGERNIGPESVEKFADALELQGDERRFFADLVEFSQADEVEERNAAFERIASRQRFRQARRIDQSMFEYLSNWYHPAIRELAARPDFEADPEWVGEHLTPSVSREKIAESLDLLFDLGLLECDERGEVTRGDPSLTTGHEVKALGVGNYHRQMLERAAESLEAFSGEVRDISALTVCIDDDMIEDFKERIHTFRERLLHRADDAEDPASVYQLNIQFFPLTDPPSDGTDE